ncbi:hypothetical protein E8E13_000432 [Curvularia kusanoi]|uniref:Bicarbonate transporter-like transmembrane domain-containing protein n=1 Tax=Curvularia kusanoi TaxID=90978 RepID=A0A9P4T2X2_CURKU|nr:hypothetical protein E8E13_000432 [Curvularia kusanoi]
MTEDPKKRRGKFGSLFVKDAPLQPGRLLAQDFRFLIIRYKTDWKPFNAVVFSSIIFVFCCSIFPALTFANALFTRTDSHWGPIEVIFSTGLCGTIFSIFSVQPLTIVGVTGPFSVLADSIYTLVKNTFDDVEFLPLMAWTLIHTAWMLVLLAIFNAYEWTMVYVTDFTCEIFGLLTSTVYFNNAIQELMRSQQNVSFAAFLWALVSCVGTFLLALLLNSAPNWPPILGCSVRTNMQRYAVPISFFTFTALGFLPGITDLDEAPLNTSSERFRPSLPTRTGFFVEFWKIPAVYVFGSIAPAIIITMLLFFDHNISSIMCTAKKYNTRKPSGLAQPIVLLGFTTALCGLLGIPPANGLLPQAPLHSESLLYETNEPLKIEIERPDAEAVEYVEPHKTVYEQRYSNLISAGTILIFVAPPFQKLLSFTPTAVLAGIFLLYAYQTVTTNPILHRLGYMLTPKSQLPPLPAGVSRWRDIHTWTLTQLVITYSIFGITQSPAGPAFPIIVFSLVPLRLKVLKRYWSPHLLRHVDRWACKHGFPEDEEPKPSPPDDTEDDGKVIDISSRRQSYQLSNRVKRASINTIDKFRGSQYLSPWSSSPYPLSDDISMNVLLSADDLSTAKDSRSSADPRIFKAREWVANQNQPSPFSHKLEVPTAKRPNFSKRRSLPAMPLDVRRPGLTVAEEESIEETRSWDSKEDFSNFGASFSKNRPEDGKGF